MNQPDPVQDPTGYVEMVLSYLGQDDPAEVQARTPDLLGSLVREGAERLRVRGAPGEWSALELIGHLTQSEVVALQHACEVDRDIGKATFIRTLSSRLSPGGVWRRPRTL
jgi:hypothetical protein